MRKFKDIKSGDSVWDYFENDIRPYTVAEIIIQHRVRSNYKIELEKVFKLNNGYKFTLIDDENSFHFDFNHCIFTTYEEAEKYKENIESFDNKLVYKR